MTFQTNPSFSYPLALKLSLEADGQQGEITSGNLENISLDLHSYGFSATLQFSGIDDEELNTVFNSEKPIKAIFTCLSTEPLLELKGIVIDRKVKRIDEATYNQNLPIYLYQIKIQDHLQATWNEHFPINIYVNKSMKDVLEEHKNPEIDIKYDFPPLEKVHPIIAFSLACDESLPISGQTSFCSFVNWYLHQEGGILIYDYQTNSYSIKSEKEPEKGEPYKIREWWITPPESHLPVISRFNAKTLKHTPASFDSEDEENENSFASVRRDTIQSTTSTLFPEHAFEKIKSPLNPKKPFFEISPLHFEGDFHLDKLVPGSFIKFFSNESSWTQDSFYKDQVFRSRVFRLDAQKLQTPDLDKPIQSYEITIKTLLESKEETYIERPPFYPPTFPFSIQGKVFSDVGDKEQSTFKISETEEHPQGHYLVDVPLAGKDQRLVVPFTPDLTNGQFYFPFTKDQQVLLSVYFHTAKIQRLIDWQPLARLPAGVQGNQIVLSSNGKDKYAILRHEFENGNQSVITLQQATSDTQLQTILLKDKDVIVTVDLKDKKTLQIRLNTDEGISIKLEDQSSKMTQTIALDGKQISHECKNDSDTSTYVQKPDSITVTCKNFNVSSETIVLEAKDSISQKASSKTTIETPMTNVKGKMKVGG